MTIFGVSLTVLSTILIGTGHLTAIAFKIEMFFLIVDHIGLSVIFVVLTRRINIRANKNDFYYSIGIHTITWINGLVLVFISITRETDLVLLLCVSK
jgi:hypothetical protein